VLERSLTDLYELGHAVLSVSVVPVGLTEFSRHERVREPTPDECRRAVETVNAAAGKAIEERSEPWAFGSDELYLIADLPLPPAHMYGAFDQVENGVGSVRFLEREIHSNHARLPDLSGRRIAVVTGTAMGRLMPQVIDALEAATGGAFETLSVTNGLFGPRVTTAGLLSGQDIQHALHEHDDVDMALIPGEALNDDGLFVDDLSLEALKARCPFPVLPSHTFVDALAALPAR
jgi:NifB/MoaA-like Fe-S oxidoreductase